MWLWHHLHQVRVQIREQKILKLFHLRRLGLQQWLRTKIIESLSSKSLAILLQRDSATANRTSARHRLPAVPVRPKGWQRVQTTCCQAAMPATCQSLASRRSPAKNNTINFTAPTRRTGPMRPITNRHIWSTHLIILIMELHMLHLCMDRDDFFYLNFFFCSFVV